MVAPQYTAGTVYMLMCDIFSGMYDEGWLIFVKQTVGNQLPSKGTKE